MIQRRKLRLKAVQGLTHGQGPEISEVRDHSCHSKSSARNGSHLKISIKQSVNFFVSFWTHESFLYKHVHLL